MTDTVDAETWTSENNGWVVFESPQASQIAHLIRPDQEATLCGRYKDKLYSTMVDKVRPNPRHCQICTILHVAKENRG